MLESSQDKLEPFDGRGLVVVGVSEGVALLAILHRILGLVPLRLVRLSKWKVHHERGG